MSAAAVPSTVGRSAPLARSNDRNEFWGDIVEEDADEGPKQVETYYPKPPLEPVPVDQEDAQDDKDWKIAGHARRTTKKSAKSKEAGPKPVELKPVPLPGMSYGDAAARAPPPPVDIKDNVADGCQHTETPFCACPISWSHYGTRHENVHVQAPACTVSPKTYTNDPNRNLKICWHFIKGKCHRGKFCATRHWFLLPNERA
jgi:hypothetical protein